MTKSHFYKSDYLRTFEYLPLNEGDSRRNSFQTDYSRLKDDQIIAT